MPELTLWSDASPSISSFIRVVCYPNDYLIVETARASNQVLGLCETMTIPLSKTRRAQQQHWLPNSFDALTLLTGLLVELLARAIDLPAPNLIGATSVGLVAFLRWRTWRNRPCMYGLVPTRSLLRRGLGALVALVGLGLMVVTGQGQVVLLVAAALILLGDVPWRIAQWRERDGYEIGPCLSPVVEPRGPEFSLVFESGLLVGERFYLVDEVTTLGQVDGNDICLPDPYIGKRHCGFKVEEGRLEVADFGTTQGTSLNGRKIERTVLGHGDTIRVGQSDLRVQQGEAPLREQPRHLAGFRLVFETGGIAGLPLPLDQGTYVIGRHPDNAVVITEDAGCVFRSQDGWLEVYNDLASTHRTLVNGQGVERAVLGHGDRVQVGSHRLRVEHKDSVVTVEEATLCLPSPIAALAWHPRRPLLAAACDDGELYVLEWQRTTHTLEITWTLRMKGRGPERVQWARHGLALGIEGAGKREIFPVGCVKAPPVEVWLDASPYGVDGALARVVNESGILIED